MVMLQRYNRCKQRSYNLISIIKTNVSWCWAGLYARTVPVLQLARPIITPPLARLYPLIFAAHCASLSLPSALCLLYYRRLSWSWTEFIIIIVITVRRGSAAFTVDQPDPARPPWRRGETGSPLLPWSFVLPSRPNITCHIYIVISIVEFESAIL